MSRDVEIRHMLSLQSDGRVRDSCVRLIPPVSCAHMEQLCNMAGHKASFTPWRPE